MKHPFGTNSHLMEVREREAFYHSDTAIPSIALHGVRVLFSNYIF